MRNEKMSYGKKLAGHYYSIIRELIKIVLWVPVRLMDFIKTFSLFLIFLLMKAVIEVIGWIIYIFLAIDIDTGHVKILNFIEKITFRSEFFSDIFEKMFDKIFEKPDKYFGK